MKAKRNPRKHPVPRELVQGFPVTKYHPPSREGYRVPLVRGGFRIVRKKLPD